MYPLQKKGGLMRGKHIHKYRRLKLGQKNYIVYECVLPNCPHFLNEKLVDGRACVCWRCGNPFVMNPETHLLKPHCKKCTRGPKER